MMFRLGVAYRDGYGAADIDEAKAREWLLEAARMSHPAAQYALGALMLQQADCGAETAAQAELWLRRASDMLHPDAALALARLYVRRRDVPAIGGLTLGWCARLLRPSSKSDSFAGARLALVVGAVPIGAMVALSAGSG